MPLYERIIGDAWRELDAPVRRLHTTGEAMRGAGLFTVRRGTGWATRALARLLGLPASGENVSVSLVVTPFPGGERWQRIFGKRSFVTVQREHAAGLLADRIGPMEMLFRLEVRDGALFYQQAGAALRLGPWRLPLPRPLAPRILASERAAAGALRVRVSVRVTAPLAGLLIEYAGHVERVDEPAR